MTTEVPPAAISLPDPPTDGITQLQYLKDPKSLLASTSWDGSVRIHDTATQSLKLQHAVECGPLLSLAVAESNDHLHSLVTGGLDGSIRLVDVQTSEVTKVGQHQEEESSGSNTTTSAACSCLMSLAASSSPSVVASAGWHRQLHIWDIRTQTKPVKTITLPGKAFSMDLDPVANRIVVVTSGRRTCFIDIRGTHGSETALVLDRESFLKYQLRSVRFFNDGQAIAVGSVEGRVAVEYLDELTESKNGKNYAFKCHRNGDIVYPVNCIEFHPRFGTFATGGCDGTVGTCNGIAVMGCHVM